MHFLFTTVTTILIAQSDFLIPMPGGSWATGGSFVMPVPGGGWAWPGGYAAPIPGWDGAWTGHGWDRLPGFSPVSPWGLEIQPRRPGPEPRVILPAPRSPAPEGAWPYPWSVEP